MKILWHTFTDPDSRNPYGQRLIEYIEDQAPPEVKFEFRGLTPPDQHVHRITEMRSGAQVVASLIEAESSGYDVAVIGHFQDPGLWEARSALEIPVLGLGEASLLYACMFGRRVGLITIAPGFIDFHEEQIHQYRLDGRVAGVTAMETEVSSYMAAFGGDSAAYEDVKRQFEQCAHQLVAAGAEVLIPAGGLPALLLCDEKSLDLDGAAILNPVLVLAQQGQVAGSIRDLCGFGTSRKAAFAKPSRLARDEFVEQLGGHGTQAAPRGA